MKNSSDQGVICRILHILRKPNSIIALLFNYSKYFQTLKEENDFFVFLLTKNNTTSPPGFSVNGTIIGSFSNDDCDGGNNAMPVKK